MSIEAMKMALEALEQIKCSMFHPAKVFTWDPSIIALRAAIEQGEKPMAWFHADNYKTRFTTDPSEEMVGKYWKPLYTAPRQEQYDQTSLELCEKCGWKAIIPSEGCLVCARQKAKPVAYADSRVHGWPDCFVMEPDPPHTVPLYTEPREWVGLTDEEIVELIKPAMSYYGYNPDHAVLTSGAGFVGLADAIEAKLKEKNAA